MKITDKKNIEDILPLTPMQQAMLFHYLKAPESDYYFEQLCLSITGEIDLTRFKQAWALVLETNDILRTRFIWERITKPMQVILKKSPLQFIFHDFSNGNRSENDKRNLVQGIKNNDRKNKFNLNSVPFRITLCKLGQAEFEMMISNHHILYDGWSNGILLKEFFSFYHHLVQKKSPQKPHKHKYKEYISWIQGQDGQKQREYWARCLGGIDTRSELSIKRKKEKNISTVLTGNFQYKINFSKAGRERIEIFTKSHKITLACLLYSAWAILLQRYNNSEDIIFGTTVSGRSSGVKGIEDIVGLFINTVPLRVQTNSSGHEKIKDFISRVNQGLREREAYESASLVEIKEYSEVGFTGELFDTIVVIENYPLDRVSLEKNSPLSLSVDSYSMFETTHYDLTVGITLIEDIEVEFTYNQDLFDETVIKKLSRHFVKIVEDMVDSPGKELAALEILSEAEKDKILVEFNHTAADYPGDKTIHQLFAEQVEHIPDHIALIGQVLNASGGLAAPDDSAVLTVQPARPVQLTYRQLDERSGKLAGLLIEEGVQPDTIVGIMIERSLEMIISILGILKVGGTYLPIDPGYPEERKKYMLTDSNAKILLTSREITNLFTPEALLNLSEGHNFTNDHLAYIIYTSGTTGKPRGVMVEHSAVMNRLFWVRDKYRLNERDVILQATSFVFDVSVCEMFRWIPAGGRLCLLPPGGEKDPEQIINTIARNRVTTADFIPAMLILLLDYVHRQNRLKALASLRWVWTGVEVVELNLVKRFNEILHRINRTRLINAYGPTESTVDVTYFDCSHIENHDVVPIGKPMANVRVYILSINGTVQPVGVYGQLCIAGKALARGYLNNPELTLEKFDHDLWDLWDYHDNNQKLLRGVQGGGFLEKSPPGRLYQTGDLARWLPDGNIQFLGRIDFQVKVRGFRVELGEIEKLLLKHPGIKEAVVVLQEEKSADKYLCAYFVADKEYGISELREYMSMELPNYMIPSYFMRLEQFPLTVNGKIDRCALPAPELKSGQSYAAPGNNIEKKLIGLWAEILARDPVHQSQLQTSIGIHDNFFQLGGHSLKATTMVSKIHKELEVKVELLNIFRTPTIRDIARLIQGLKKEAFQDIEPVEKKEYYPLSSAQKRLYFLQQLDLNSTGYNMTMVLPLGQGIKKDKLEFSLKQLIARHESLRTSIQRVNEEVVQRIHPADGIEFSLDHYEAGQTGIEEIIKRYLRSFDLSRAPLIRSGLIMLPGDYHTWMVDIHHIVSDGTSHTILVEDFMQLYETGAPLEPLFIQYKDFAQWQNQLFAGSGIQDQEDYWLQLYSGEIPRLNLAADYKRPAIFTFEGDHHVFKLEREEAVKFKVLGARYGGTLYMNIMAVLNTLFYKYTGQTDIIIGSGIAGRRHADIQGVVGMFANTLAMRNYPAGEKSYENFLSEVIANSVKGFENQDVQFEELVEKLEPERDPSRNPLFDILMVVQNFRELSSNISAEQLLAVDENSPAIQYKNTTSKFDLTFFVHEQGDDVFINIEYYTGIFTPETIRRLVSHFKYVVKTVIEDPGINLKEIAVISEEEKQRVLDEFNDTARDYPRDKSIPGLFAEQVERTPDSIALAGAGCPAVFCRGRTGTNSDHNMSMVMTYRHLHEQSNRLANYLYHGNRVALEQSVGIMMDRSLEMITAVIGILKAGGAYVPVSPSYPLERIKKMINDAGIKILLSQKRYIKTLNRLQWECGANLETFLCIDSHDVYGEEEAEENQLMSRKLWEYIGETAVDEVTGGGWKSSYTGESIPKEEMDEYGDNILRKLEPLLHLKMRVLEIGVASGISMYRIAPRVGLYYGTDLSRVIIEKNTRRIMEEGYKNIKLLRAAAHEIHRLDEKDFDLVIINSVIQCFHGHNYLRNVIRKAIDLVGSRGYLFIGDIMDQDLKEELIAHLTRFKQGDRGKVYKTKTDWSEELFISRSFFEDLAWDFPEIYDMEFSGKINTIENELTRFRYDALIKIDRTGKESKKIKPKHRHKTCHDLRILRNFGSDQLGLWQDGDNLAYIIYTSGSTGIPKGVMVNHRNVVRLVKDTNFIEFKPDDRILQTGALEFDASTLEIWGALLNGLLLVLERKENLLEAGILKEITARHKITVMWMTSSFFNQILDEDVEVFRGLRYLLAGGEALSPSHINRLRPRFPGLYIINGYGPTENTTFSTTFLIDKEYTENIPIGRPIANSTAYVLDRDGNLLPPGVAGELYAGGDGVARGYLNSPELTAERFIELEVEEDIYHKSYRTCMSYIIYRTGDLVRWLANGVIEFLGRIDTQVKIRGYRIEMSEIAIRLLKYEPIKEAVVIDLVDATGSKYLCAYIVIDEEFQLTGFRDLLSKDLPEYMIPSYFIPMKAIPLTSNGKVDRKALPGPEAAVIGGDNHGAYAAPRDEIEKKLVEIWHEVLSLPHHAIGLDDNFFQLGGHSLTATALVSRIHKELDVKIPLVEIFKTPSIRELAAYIKGMTRELHVSMEPVEEREYYVLSSAQKRLYFLQQFDLSGIGYNMPLVLPLGKGIEKNKIESVLRRLIDRHESLRTFFEKVNEEVVQRIQQAGSIQFSLDYYESGKTGLGEIIKHYIKPFDLSRPPLIRSGLIVLPEGNCTWIVDVHHIVSDGTSHTILMEDFMAEYSGKELKPLHLQYKDFALWQQRRYETGKIKKQMDYWLGLLAGEIPRLNLPLDYKRPEIFTFEGDSYGFALPRQEAKKFKRLGALSGGTLYMNMLAALNVLLYKYTGQSDIIIGSGVAGRRHADLQGIVGMFINTLAMRNYPEGEKTYESFMKEVITGCVRGFENQDAQFEELVDNLDLERDASRNAVFDIMMIVQNYRRVGEGGGDSKVEYADMSAMDILPAADENPVCSEYKNPTSKFDMTFYVHEQEDDILINIEYYSAVFKPAAIQRVASHLKNVIKAVVTDSFIKLKDIQLISDDEKKKVIYEFNQTQRDYPGDKTIHRLFEEQAVRTPDYISLVGIEGEAKNRRRPIDAGDGIHLSYRELNERSAKLAGLLIEKGVQSDTIVGIIMERSLEMIIGIMGILKSGGAYMPIDPKDPGDRIDYMLKDSSARILVSMVSELSKLSEEIELIDLNNIEFNKDFTTPAAYPTYPTHPTHLTQLNLAYIIYTSGSTGKPKGVLTTHANVIRVVKNTNYIDIESGDRLLQLSNYAFDGSVFDIYGALLNGAGLVLINKDEVLEIRRLLGVIKREGITVFFVTTALFNTLVEMEISCFHRVRKVLFGGERVSVEHSMKALEYLGKDRIIHVYGPTETTVYATYYFIDSMDAAAGNIPIGKPISNTTIYILDKHLKPVLIGVTGEIYIGGTGVARGYLNNPELTAEKFDHDLWDYLDYRDEEQKVPGEKTHMSYKSHMSNIYRTGDLARWLPDGNIEFLGRIDHQVKIRGFRVELGEIESQLKKHMEIKEAVVLAGSYENGDRYLCAYITAIRDILVSELREYLVGRLPGYMIPSRFVLLEEIPLTSNRKVDRQKLNSLGKKLSTGVEHVAPKSDNEIIIADAWKKILKLDEIGIYDNFFDLGGTSLNIIRLNSKLKEIFKRDISIIAMYRYTTIDSFSHFLGTANANVENSPASSRDKERADKIKKGMEDKKKRREIRSRRRK
ncbi:MAG: amino acid adenylation domain-containing protein [Candidatus Aminicenantes bacterium]|jgi:amino acid adenylation domain-containing protein